MVELTGVRVLIVEDEPLLSLTLQDMLADMHCEVVGTAGRIETAMKLAQSLCFDVAVLDINLGGLSVEPVAEAIAARGLPLVFVTGYGRNGAPPHLTAPVLEKPYEAAGLRGVLSEALGAGDG